MQGLLYVFGEVFVNHFYLYIFYFLYFGVSITLFQLQNAHKERVLETRPGHSVRVTLPQQEFVFEFDCYI